MPVRTRPALAVAVATLVAAGAAACAPQDDTSAPAASGSAASGTAAPAADACTKAKLPTKTAGKLTIGTDKPAYAPWFVDDKPSNGKGYESAVAYAAAERLGYTKADVSWIVVPFTNAYAPGDKKFDLDVNQVSITEPRRKAVDFSSGYYDVAQAVVTVKGSKIADAKSMGDLRSAKLGAQVGTTSYTAITQQLRPSHQVAVYDTNDLAVQALKNGQVDGIVADLPTAFYMTSAQLDDGVIVGQLPPNGTPDQFGFVLAKGSPLTSCVSGVVDDMRNDGTLATFASTWLSGDGGAPVLQ